MTPNDDRKIREKLQQKTWNEIKTNDSWAIFKIMAEFVDGWQFLADFKKTVTFFGSARLKEGSKWYEEARGLARMLAQNGFGVVSGGGPGIMEAGNRGASEIEAPSIGLNIVLPHEQAPNVSEAGV